MTSISGVARHRHTRAHDCANLVCAELLSSTLHPFLIYMGVCSSQVVQVEVAHHGTKTGVPWHYQCPGYAPALILWVYPYS
jgi:hypothetical protein